MDMEQVGFSFYSRKTFVSSKPMSFLVFIVPHLNMKLKRNLDILTLFQVILLLCITMGNFWLFQRQTNLVCSLSPLV